MQFQQTKPPVGVVFDADFGNRIEDALALASLYGLQGKNESRVISVSSSRPGLNSALFADTLVRFYTGDPGPFGAPTPIGLALGNGAPDTPLMSAVLGRTEFARGIQQMNDTADPVALIRNALSAQFDANAVVVLAGPATNLAQVLDLPGARQLITAKVRYLVAALGNLNGRSADPRVRADLGAARKLFAEWPTPVVAAGSEIGEAVKFPAAGLDKNFAWAPLHPIVEAYRAAGAMPYDAPAASLAAALYAVRPKEGYFQLSSPGTISVDAEGRTKFTAADNGRHRYLIADAAKTESLQQVFVETAGTHPIPRATRFRPPQQKKQ